MVSWLDFEGKTVDAALQKASKELDLPLEKLSYEIVSTGSSGIFGLVGAKNACIRVAPDTIEEQDVSQEEDREAIQSLVDETFLGADEASEAAPEKAETQDAEPASAGQQPAAKVDDDVLEQGRETLQKIVDQITEEASTTWERQEKYVLFKVEGGNAGVLIGKHGQTLKAMQHILEKVMHKRSGQKVRVLVDVASYMEKRQATLKSLADRLAEKVRQTGKPTTINRMDSFERKIIHDALRKDKSVKTRSTGEGDIRNVVIQPGRKKWHNKKSSPR